MLAAIPPFPKGTTYYFPSTPSFTVSDAGGASFRALLKFGGLHSLLPVGASVASSALNLTFTNWGSAQTLQVCVCLIALS